jgi:hypothetical protein
MKNPSASTAARRVASPAGLSGQSIDRAARAGLIYI